MTEGQNFRNQATPDIIDDEYVRCTFAQDQPVDVGGGVFEGVRLFPGDDTPRTFTECNLCNCEPPPGSTVTACNTTIRQTNLESYSETVTVDGDSFTLQHHKHVVHGRWTPGGYEYKGTPEEIEAD